MKHFFDGVIPLYVELEGNVVFQLCTTDGADALFGIFGQWATRSMHLLFVLFPLGEILESLWAKVTLIPEITIVQHC